MPSLALLTSLFLARFAPTRARAASPKPFRSENQQRRALFPPPRWTAGAAEASFERGGAGDGRDHQSAQGAQGEGQGGRQGARRGVPRVLRLPRRPHTTGPPPAPPPPPPPPLPPP